MLRLIFFAAIILVFESHLGWTRNLNRKRDIGFELMNGRSEYDYEEDSYNSGWAFPSFTNVEESFLVEYDKQFDTELLDPDSPAFEKEVQRVKRYMTQQIARNVGVISDDLTVDVKSFKGNTAAEITVTVPGYFGISKEDLRKAVADITEYGEINGHFITKITEFEEEAPEDVPEEPEDVIIDLELTYEFDSSAGSLSDRDSEDFTFEAHKVQQELTLHIVANLAEHAVFINPDQINISVLSFRSVGNDTAVTLSVQAKKISIENLSEALNSLVIEDGVGINGRLVLLIEELTRSIPDEDYYGENFPETNEEVMTPHGNENEPEPPDSDEDTIVLEKEVMPDMEYVENEPPTDYYYMPDLVDPTINEEFPPEYNPDEPVPPFPGEEFPDHCSVVRDPERGSAQCDNGNDIGSTCTFTCQEETRMEGPSVINCHEDGAWDADAPYCIRIFCQPHYILFHNGDVSCTNHNRFASKCTFSCNERYTLKGSHITQCQDDSTWTEPAPTCEPDPVDCENEYGPWSDCEDGKRFKDAVFVTAAGSSVLCPEIMEDCVDCTLEWGPWGVCSENVRVRTQFIAAGKVGAGKECPELQIDKEACIDCVIEWGAWSTCKNEMRSRSQYVAVQSVGQGKECPPLEEETEECIHCRVEWGEWEVCKDDLRTRTQYIVQERVGTGDECPEILNESEDCIDCVIEWEEWSTCENEMRSRSQYVAIPSIGQGLECPPLERETESCIDCKLEWGNWGECENGQRTRVQYIPQIRIGAGAECSRPQRESEVCTDCVLVWEEWSECVDGYRGRAQIVEIPAIGAGRPCEQQLEEIEACVDCEVGWGDWSECAGGSRSRSQVVITQREGVGADCPALIEENEDCVDCVLEWGSWDECISGQRMRVQEIVTSAVGAGKQCEEELEIKDCNECEISWGDWDECSNGIRSRRQFISKEPIEVDVGCPVLQEEIEDCIDCVVIWGQWSECSEGTRLRSEIISTETVGAGKECPDLQLETEACINCVMEWGNWSPCDGVERTRTEYVVLYPIGAGESCPVPRLEREACQDCVVEWGDWGGCADNERVRYEIIIQESIAGGTPCPPELRRDVEACIHCVLDWESWTPCENNLRTRKQFILVQPFGEGTPCPEIETQEEECVDCEISWGEWSECRDDERERHQYIVHQSIGAGEQCPVLTSDTEVCIDCRIQWGEWSECINNEKTRSQFIAVFTVGAGAECLPTEEESQDCVNCEVDWEDWGECINDQRTKSQYISMMPEGGGKQCPPLETRVEPCIDCVVEWTPWTPCFQERKSRNQIITVELVGAGKECPPLESETEDCVDTGADQKMEEKLCRFTDRVLGYRRRPQMRDLLLIGDESGSIGWINYEKIKRTFKAVSNTIRGGIGTQETQIAMMSFARLSRFAFMFDDYYDVTDMTNAIDGTFYKGGYRSMIGSALAEANAWVFQQTGGMRSFPNIDDNIVHEILIATDGCRTSDVYMLKKGLEVIKKRGIKLYVLAIASKDIRCRETVQSMVEDSDNLFEIENWQDLDKFNELLENRSCVPRTPPSRGDGQLDLIEEDEE